MDIITKLNMLNKKIEEAKANYERARGRMEAADKAIADAGFSSAEELDTAIKAYEAKLRDMNTELESGVTAFMEKYGELLK